MGDTKRIYSHIPVLFNRITATARTSVTDFVGVECPKRQRANNLDFWRFPGFMLFSARDPGTDGRPPPLAPKVVHNEFRNPDLKPIENHQSPFSVPCADVDDALLSLLQEIPSMFTTSNQPMARRIQCIVFLLTMGYIPVHNFIPLLPCKYLTGCIGCIFTRSIVLQDPSKGPPESSEPFKVVRVHERNGSSSGG